MAVGETIHSRIVVGLKILLPLVALGLLSTVFLLSRSATEDPDLTFLDDASEIPGRDSVTAPYYTGSTPEGHAVSITADSARPMPDDPAGVLAQNLSASFDLTDGSRVDITARNAAVNEPADRLELSGDVVIDSSTGYVVRTDLLQSSLRRLTADAPGGVTATGPIGTLTAGAFRIREQDEDSAGAGSDTGTRPAAEPARVQLFFTNGVKLVYLPQNDTPDEESERP